MKKTIKWLSGFGLTHYLAGVVLFGVSLQAMALNPIQIENAIPPVAADYEWSALLRPANPHYIEGYADQASVNVGSTIKFYVNAQTSRNSTYKLTLYRLGYYSGAGGRRMTGPVTLPSVTQVLPTPDPVSGLIECNWTDPYAFVIPSNWTSGVYLATIVGTTTGEGSYIPFVVKQVTSTADYVFQTSDTTWQAYNGWGGKSLYGYNSTNGVQAVKVSYNRPNDGGNGFGSLGNWELQTLRFLEKNGYDVTYQSNIDTHTGGVSQLLKHKAYLSVGHDEYWSKAMRDNVENARAQGVSLGFFGANNAYWQMRFENSPITGAANRTIVAYKETAANDPIGTPSLVTSKWRDPLYANRPENALIGIMYIYDPVNGDIVISNASHWVFTGTGLQNGDSLPGLLGYEIDAYASNGQAPAGVEILANSAVSVPQTIYGNMSIYTQACTLPPCNSPAATVFATGSMQWAWGLDSFWTNSNFENPAAKQVTHNVLARLVNSNAILPAIPPNALSPTNTAPVFVGGTTFLTLPQNSPAIDLKPNLHISDTDAGQTETWSQSTAPSHGTLILAGATASSGSSNITPSGTLTYQPAVGYTGADSFAVRVSDGIASAIRTFSVTVTASGTGPNLLINPSLELDTDNNNQPDCWLFGGYGTNTVTWTRTNDAYTGNFAQQLQITSYINGDRKLLPGLDASQSAGGCAPAVQAGANYQISAYYKSTASANVILFYLDATGVWQYWKNGPGLPATAAWSQMTYSIGVLPAGAKAVSFGIALAGVGTLITDDYAFTQILTNPPTNTAPTFVGSSTSLTMPQNSLAIDLKPNLHISDIDAGQSLTWSQSVAPGHGTLVLSGATASSGSSDITPSGTLTYQPATGYSGADSFAVRVSDGIASAIRTFSVTVTATGIGQNLLINPSLELDADSNNQPDCWLFGGYGTNTVTWTRTNDAYTGNFAQQLQITSYTNGDRKLLPGLDASQSAGGCAPAVQAGANYQISAYYKSTASAKVILFYLDATGVWQYWKNGPDLSAAAVWSPMTYSIGVLPAGAKAVSFGIGLNAVGTLITDDYAFVQVL